MHYPGDILVGLLWGGLVGYGVYRLYLRVAKPVAYGMYFCEIPVLVLVLTAFCAVLYSLVCS